MAIVVLVGTAFDTILTPCSKFDLEQISFIVVNNSFLWFVEYMVRTPYMIVIKRDSK